MSEQLQPERRRFGLRKLVRDGILKNMIDTGQNPNFKVATGRQKLGFLEDKAIEEANELRLDPDNIPNSLEELADLQQVIDDAAHELGSSPEDVRAIQLKKFQEKGGFQGGNFVITVDVDSVRHPEMYRYYMDNPDRFPQHPD